MPSSGHRVLLHTRPLREGSIRQVGAKPFLPAMCLAYLAPLHSWGRLAHACSDSVLLHSSRFSNCVLWHEKKIRTRLTCMRRASIPMMMSMLPAPLFFLPFSSSPLLLHVCTLTHETTRSLPKCCLYAVLLVNVGPAGSLHRRHRYRQHPLLLLLSRLALLQSHLLVVQVPIRRRRHSALLLPRPPQNPALDGFTEEYEGVPLQQQRLKPAGRVPPESTGASSGRGGTTRASCRLLEEEEVEQRCCRPVRLWPLRFL